MIFVLPIPLNFVNTVVGPPAYEVLRVATALCGWLAMTCVCGWGCMRFAGDFSCNRSFFGGAGDGCGDSMHGFDSFTGDSNATIFVDDGVYVALL